MVSTWYKKESLELNSNNNIRRFKENSSNSHHPPVLVIWTADQQLKGINSFN